MQLQPHHVGIVVSNLDRSTAFYRALGFEITSEIPFEDGAKAIRFMRCGSLHVELFWYAETFPAPPSAGSAQLGFRHLAFLVDDVNATLGELKAAGIVPAGVESRDVSAGFRIAFFEDPDGLEIELTQQL
ncbi:MAG: hypothetical protein CVT59_03810 [Actinobacteria bacterium HGW-Actinobacteria-1]|jgi:catechol 2,3-dioxygenase-like lactoylglutathione lyase family enzyme|nr:MAG: hypothetical protein CVT59_03810 [Actinobacteria bacterium HGW-Actinobacteria-1]